MAFLLNTQAQVVSGKTDNLPKHNGAEPNAAASAWGRSWLRAALCSVAKSENMGVSFIPDFEIWKRERFPGKQHGRLINNTADRLACYY